MYAKPQATCTTCTSQSASTRVGTSRLPPTTAAGAAGAAGAGVGGNRPGATRAAAARDRHGVQVACGCAYAARSGQVCLFGAG